MKIINFMGKVTLVALLLGQSVVASECALISTIKVPIDKDIRQLVLTRHNGQQLSQPISLSHGAFGVVADRKMYLAPGQHKFTGFAGNDGVPCAAKITAKYRKSHADRCEQRGHDINVLPNLSSQFGFTINVEANKVYGLATERVYPKTVVKSAAYAPVVLKTEDRECTATTQEVILASLPEVSELVTHTALPETLQNEFNLLMLEINEFAKQLYPANTNIAISRELENDYIYGLYGEAIKQDQYFGVLVKGVSAESQAEQLGLRKNDIITDVNGKRLTEQSPNLMSTEIANLKVGQSYNIQIVRGGKALILEGVYQPKQLVAFNLTFNNYTQQPAPTLSLNGTE